LHTSGPHIVAANGQRVRLVSVNWFGAESAEFVVGGLDRQPLAKIVATIRRGGFNSVRLPWSNELVARNPVVDVERLAANPQLQGRKALEVLDAVIDELGKGGLLVILDNHRSHGEWCCDEAHGDGLWHTPQYPESIWISHWRAMAARHLHRPHVVAAELRNEIRRDPSQDLAPTWGDGDPRTDWRAAAERGGNAVLEVNPNLLIIVGGIDYQTHLSGVRTAPVRLATPNRLVYAAHTYPWTHAPEELRDDAAFAAAAERRWDYVRAPAQSYTAPVYISEWGACVQADSSGKTCTPNNTAYLNTFARYARASQIDWAYWPLNGTQSAGYERKRGAIETFGLLNTDWSEYVDPGVLHALQEAGATPTCAR
jgi:endoglucanase